MSDKDLEYFLNLKDEEFSSVRRSPLYFGSEEKRLLGWLHRTDSLQQSDTCVVLCPPLSVEYVSTYRSIRYVADYFALAGMPAFRFDYHGTGDSSGLNDEGNRLDDWLWSIEQAYYQAKQLTGCSKVGFFGLRMGGTLAALMSEKLDLDFLVIWAALERGQRFIRETRAIQMTGISQTDGETAKHIEAGGMVYWPQTVEAIRQINLADIAPKAQRTLIVPRDDLQSNTTLKLAWENHGAFVEQAEYPGSSSMLLVALESIVPHDSIAKIVQWVTGGVKEATPSKSHFIANGGLESSALIRMNSEVSVKESILRFGPDSSLFSILTEPFQPSGTELPIIIIANSGANHRVGPSRLYVTLARELACLGFRSLRIDIPGLGDSIIHDREKENYDYIANSSEIIQYALEAFGPGYKENKFIITGLCSGAYFSFHAALDLDDVNIVESILINPLTFYWHEGMEFDDSPTKNFGYWNWYKKAIKDPKSWKKLIQGGANYRALFDTIKNRMKIVISAKMKSHCVKSNKVGADYKSTSSSSEGNLNADLITLASQNRHLSLVLATSDPGYDILMTSAGKTARKLIKSGNIDIHMIEDADHTFSKYQPRCDAINVIVKHIAGRYMKK